MPRLFLRALTLAGVVSIFAIPGFSQTWSQVSAGNPPIPNQVAGVGGYDPATNRMVVFGATYSGGWINWVWVLTSANGLGSAPQWLTLSPIADPNNGFPPPRSPGGGVAYDAVSNRLIIMDGCLALCGAVVTDTWVLTNANGLGGTPAWFKLSPAGGAPAPRVALAATYDPGTNSLIVFGGQNGCCANPVTDSDTWVLSNANGLGGTPVWTQLTPTGGPPPGQTALSGVYDQVNNRLVVFGGWPNQTPSPTNAVWVLSNANGSGGTPTWTNLVSEGAVGSPPARVRHDAVYDSSSNSMIIFGGDTGTGAFNFNDTWMLSNANGLGGTPAWKQLNTTGGPPAARNSFAGAFDPMSHRMIIFGGYSATSGLNDTWVLAAGPLDTTLTYNGATGSDFDDPALLAATLTDQSANPIMGEQLTFTLGTQSCSATTDGTGQGSCTLKPTQAAGSYNVTVAFAGDSKYAPSSTIAPFTLLPEQDTIQYTGGRTFYKGGTATLSATLVEDGSLSLPIGGRNVTLTIGSGAGNQSCSATTNSAGQAQCAIRPLSQPLGLNSVSASFPGDAFYNSATVSASALVIGNQATAASSSIAANFNGTAIPGGSTVWFNSVLKPSGLGSTPVQIIMQNANIQFSTPAANYNLPVPNALITFSPTVTAASVSFDSGLQAWMIQAPSSGLAGNTLLNALAFQTPSGGLPGGIKSVTWAGSFVTDTPGTSLQWKWAAAVYGQFGSDYNALGVKPVDDNNASAYKNSDHAGTPEYFKTFVIGGATGGGGSNYTGGYSGTSSIMLPVQ